MRTEQEPSTIKHQHLSLLATSYQISIMINKWIWHRIPVCLDPSIYSCCQGIYNSAAKKTK